VRWWWSGRKGYDASHGDSCGGRQQLCGSRDCGSLHQIWRIHGDLDPDCSTEAVHCV